MRRLSHVYPDSVTAATTALAQDGSMPVGGGSDLLGMIKDELVAPDQLVRVKDLEGLNHVTPQVDGRVRVGGTVTLSALGRHRLVRDHYAVLAEAAESVGTAQIRNVGTLAGNMTQRPWCWYFRQKFPCYKHGGSQCFSRTGENQFNAILGGGPSYIVHPSDTAVALVALDARVRVVSALGDRWVPLREFFVLPREDVSRENALRSGEILAEVELPSLDEARSTYSKVTDREAWTHAVVSVAVVLTVSEDDGVCRYASVVLGGVAPIPWRVESVERMLVGERVTPVLAAAAGVAAVEGARPLARNRYKVSLAAETLRRALLSLS